MQRKEYARARRALLAAASWNGWAARRGYSQTAGSARRENQRALATLRAARRGEVADE